MNKLLESWIFLLKLESRKWNINYSRYKNLLCFNPSLGWFFKLFLEIILAMKEQLLKILILFSLMNHSMKKVSFHSFIHSFYEIKIAIMNFQENYLFDNLNKKFFENLVIIIAKNGSAWAMETNRPIKTKKAITTIEQFINPSYPISRSINFPNNNPPPRIVPGPLPPLCPLTLLNPPGPLSPLRPSFVEY